MQVLNGHKLLEFGEFRLDVDKKVLRRGDEIVPLPLKATELLCVLVENHGEVVPKEALMERVWADAFVEDSVLTQNIYLLRKTLRSNGTAGSIKNVPRRGYIFDASVNLEHETVIEHHLNERVEIEETEEDGAAPIIYRHRAASVLFAVGAVLLMFGGLYLYSVTRPRNAADSVSAPIRLKPPAVPSKVKTLAVLPFRGSDQGLAANFSNDLSLRLGSMNKFPVRPLALVKELVKNGTEIDADLVLEGEVRQGKNSFGADVRLVDTQTGSDTPLGRLEYNNLIQLEDAVANGVAKNVVDRLTETERQAAAKRLPSNLGAYQNFEAAYLLWRRREDGSNYLRKAIELDASFAPAYVLLANIRATGGVKDSTPAKEAEHLLQKAFDLDDNSADAYAVQGFIRIFHYRDWDGAERSLKNAVELDGDNINAHHWLGVLYSIHRRLDEAEAEMQKALDLDPTNPTLLADMGQLHYFAGETDIAREYINKALSLDPDHIQARQYLSALDALQDAHNKESELKQLIATEDTNFILPYINVDPHYDELRTDGRFQNILRRMNLDN